MKNNFHPNVPSLKSKKIIENFFKKKKLNLLIELSKKTKPTVN